MAGQEGLEPPTIGFGNRYSTNWSYWPNIYSFKLSRDSKNLHLFYSYLLFSNFTNNASTNGTATFTNSKT